MKNDLILKAAKGDDVERTPVWLMRQAGRILPEYRAVRKKVKDFKELLKTPELACEVTIQPVDILGVDAAIIFSDILVVPEAMGLYYDMLENKGPLFKSTIRSIGDINKLKKVNPRDDLGYVLETIKLTKRALNDRVPLIGFAGAPWTIFAYMVEGQGSKTFSKARKFLYTQPEAAHLLLQKITDSTIAYLQAQIREGVDLVQIFDSWAGILSFEQYNTFGLRYIRKICDALKISVPVIVFAKGAYFAMKELGQLDCQVIGLDWNMDIQKVREIIGKDKTLQGNLDPCLLYADFETIKKETVKMLKACNGKRHIANLGHGVYPDTPLDNVKCFVDTVKGFIQETG